MMLTNKTSDKQLPNTLVCRSFFSQLRGLMFRKPQTAILDSHKEKREILHTFFVFFPLDLIWLDQNWRVTELREDISPFRFWIRPNIKARYIIEAPAGTIKHTKTQLGDIYILNKI